MSYFTVRVRVPFVGNAVAKMKVVLSPNTISHCKGIRKAGDTKDGQQRRRAFLDEFAAATGMRPQAGWLLKIMRDQWDEWGREKFTDKWPAIFTSKLEIALRANLRVDQDGVEKWMWKELTDMSDNLGGRLSKAMVNNYAYSTGTPPILVGTALAADEDDNETLVVDVDSSPPSTVATQATAGDSSAPTVETQSVDIDFGSQPEPPADLMFGTLPDTQPADDETQAYY